MTKEKNATVYRLWMEDDWSKDQMLIRFHSTGEWESLKRYGGMVFVRHTISPDVALQMISAAKKAQKEIGVQDTFVVTREVMSKEMLVQAVELVDAPAELLEWL